jgi:hypothetical protein
MAEAVMRRLLPIVALILLAPVVAELLAGTIPIWQIGNLAFAVPIYGAGALLIRELVRGRGRGWTSILLLGAAYGIVEEGIATQALFSPTLYGVAAWSPRLFGINLDYTEVIVPLHAVWTAAVPILLVELAFPARRAEPWLGRAGLIVTACVYLIGVAILALGAHTQLDPGFWAPPVLLGLSLLAVVVLGVVALGILPGPALSILPGPALGHLRTDGGREDIGAGHGGPSPWRAGLVGFVGACAFLGLLIPVGDAQQPVFTQGNLVLVPMAAAIAVAVATAAMVRRWAALHQLTDRHLLGLASGSLIAHTLVFGLTRTTVAEQLSIAGLGAAMVAALALLAVAVRGRDRPNGPAHHNRGNPRAGHASLA